MRVAPQKEIKEPAEEFLSIFYAFLQWKEAVCERWIKIELGGSLHFLFFIFRADWPLAQCGWANGGGVEWSGWDRKRRMNEKRKTKGIVWLACGIKQVRSQRTQPTQTNSRQISQSKFSINRPLSIYFFFPFFFFPFSSSPLKSFHFHLPPPSPSRPEPPSSFQLLSSTLPSHHTHSSNGRLRKGPRCRLQRGWSSSCKSTFFCLYRYLNWVNEFFAHSISVPEFTYGLTIMCFLFSCGRIFIVGLQAKHEVSTTGQGAIEACINWTDWCLCQEKKEEKKGPCTTERLTNTPLPPLNSIFSQASVLWSPELWLHPDELFCADWNCSPVWIRSDHWWSRRGHLGLALGRLLCHVHWSWHGRDLLHLPYCRWSLLLDRQARWSQVGPYVLVVRGLVQHARTM